MHLLFVSFLACAVRFIIFSEVYWSAWTQLCSVTIWVREVLKTTGLQVTVTAIQNNNFQDCTLTWMIKLQDQIYAKHNHRGQWRPSEWTTSHLKSLSLSGLSWISQSKSNLDNSAAGSWMFCSADFFGLYRPYAGLAAARIDTRAFRLVMIPAFQNKMFTWTIKSK